MVYYKNKTMVLNSKYQTTIPNYYNRSILFNLFLKKFVGLSIKKGKKRYALHKILKVFSILQSHFYISNPVFILRLAVHNIRPFFSLQKNNNGYERICLSKIIA